MSHALIESLVTEVVVEDQARTDAAFAIEPAGLGEALCAALDDQARQLDHDLLDRRSGLLDGVYTVRVSVPLLQATEGDLDADLDRIGGSFRWYGLAPAWRLRALIGRAVGEFWRLDSPGPSGSPGSPAGVVEGTRVDWWVVARRAPDQLVLRAVRWFPGEAWLGYGYGRDDEQGRLVQVGSLRPKGVPGFVYWMLLRPVHAWVFEALARHRAAGAERGA